ncbi:MAG: serine/threonine protein kinase [Hyphomicrobiaceae bacterium]
MSTRDVLPPGTVLDGKYRIDRLIGQGGFGMTYEAHDLGLNLRVAVKEYYPANFGTREGTLTVRPRTSNDAELFNRLKDSFLREARTLAQLRHPCIVRVLSVFEGHGTAYMIMEYESGKSFKSWLDTLGRRPSQGELDRLVMPLLDALEMLHGTSFLHRDIAPDNIIVRADGTPVLLDFGAARRVMAELSAALTGIVKGGYSPQEQYANDPRAQGPWSDIYALGATLYRAISGRTPDEATLRMLDDPTEPAVKVGAGTYRPAFLAAIDRAMSVRPKDRQQSIAELRQELLAETTAPTRTLPRNGTVPPPAAATTTGGWDRIASPASTATADATGKRKGRLGMAATVALVLFGGLGYAAYDYRVRQESLAAAAARDDAQRVRREAEVKAEADRKAAADRLRQIDEQGRLAAEAAKRRQAAEAEQRQRAADAERQKREEASRLPPPQPSQPPPPGTGTGLAARLEEVLGPCPFCDDVKKLINPDEFSQLTGIPAIIERTVAEVANRRGPREDAKARVILEKLARNDIDIDPVGVVKTGNVKCTTYNFGFLDNAAERVGQHQCIVRSVQIGGELTSLTIEKTTGDLFHLNVKKFRVNAMAYLGRTYLKGHAITRYNQARPRNAENKNYGNKVGLLIALDGRPALISIDQAGFTEPDATYFEVTVLEP